MVAARHALSCILGNSSRVARTSRPAAGYDPLSDLLRLTSEAMGVKTQCVAGRLGKFRETLPELIDRAIVAARMA